MKIKLLILFLILLVGTIPLTYKWWPSGKAQDFVFLVIHSEDLLSLYEYSDTTSLDFIYWCKKNLTSNNFRRNERTLSQTEISDDFEVKKFITYAETKDIPCFLAHKGKRNWLIHGSGRSGESELDGKPATSQITRYYYYLEKTSESGCSERGDNKLKLRSCRNHLFSNWYMLEKTMTSLQEDVLTNDI